MDCKNMTLEDWLFVLSQVEDLTISFRWKIFQDIKNTEVTSLEDLQYLPIQGKKIESFKKQVFLKEISNEYQKMKEKKVRWLSFLDDDFPENLRHIYEPPLGLYVQGDVSLLKRPSLSVVGARKHTNYAKEVIDKVLPGIIEEGVVIVSGLAMGVDALVHQKALEHHGKTVAVIGTGHGHVYPRQHEKIQSEIATEHCLVSEYPPNVGPDRSHFPMRNRIIAGLSRGTLVIEARYRSGSLITANCALNEGKNIYAVPGSIFNPLSIGTNDLIKHGAKAIATSEDILEDYI